MKKILTLVLGILFLASSCNGKLTQKPKEATYKVTFKVQGELNFKSSTYRVLKGSTIITIDNYTDPEPLNPNEVFMGWFKEDGKEFNKSIRITEDIILVAKFFGTITLENNQVWLDRNLGATRVASSITDTDIDVCGNYYQWGRGNDGHEKRDSDTSPTQIVWNATGNNEFIKVDGNPYTWIHGEIPLGKTYNTMNNPCPTGFRVPTSAEFEKLKTAIGGVKDTYHTACFNKLKMVRCGYRTYDDASYSSVGTDGIYWGADISSANLSYNFRFSSILIDSEDSNYAAWGMSIRCIKK